MKDWTAGVLSMFRRTAESWRTRQAMAQVAAFGRRLGQSPEAALARLDGAALSPADDPAARGAWSMRVCAWIERWAASHPIAARRLVDDLIAHALRHPGEPGLKAHWALGAFYFVSARAAADPVGCVAIFRAMEPSLCADGYPYAFRRLWAMAVQRWVLALTPSDPLLAASGLGPLAGLALDTAPDVALVGLWLDTVREMLTQPLTEPEDIRQMVLAQADALALAYHRHGTTAAAIGGLQMLLATPGRAAG